MRSPAHRIFAVVLAFIVLLGVGILSKGTVSNVVSGTWGPASSMAEARSGSSAALLQDGRILLTGGQGANGPLATAEFFGTNGQFSPAAPMNGARSNHTSVVLQDGRVLVDGGNVPGGGVTNSAEIYDPTSDSWTSIPGGMIEARAGHTATLLQDGRVLIAGGSANGTVSLTAEIYDPVANQFSGAGALSSARSQHAAALLQDGRVLIVGGSDGTQPLASSDIFDPVAGTVAPGPALTAARQAHSATTLLDGRVLVAGGNNIVTNADGSTSSVDLASAEILDAGATAFSTAASALATARSGHQAFLLPHNNSVLIVGGTSNGVAIAAAELFVPWGGSDQAGIFQASGAMGTPRAGAAGSPLSNGTPSSQNDGLLLVAGGTDASTPANTLSSAELYGFATVKTDAADYPPGTTVNISGSGWQPGEGVTLTLVESPLIDTHGPYTVIADANGNISDSSFTTDSHDVGVTFFLTAVGQASGYQAQTKFTDKVTPNVTVNCTPNPVGVNNLTSCTVTVAHNGAGGSLPTGTVTFSPTGSGTFSPSSQCVLSGSGNSASCSVGYTPTSIDAGSQTITANYPGDSNYNSNSGNTALGVYGAATQLAFGQQPSNTAAGSAISPAVTVKVEDTNGTLVANSSASITLSLNDPAACTGAFAGGSTTTVSAANGVATFNNLVIDTACTGYTLTAASGVLPQAQSSPFSITAAAATQLVFINTPVTVAASACSTALTVQSQDSNGNPSNVSTAKSVNLSSNSGGGTFYSDSGCTTQVTTLTIAAHNNSITFYYKDTNPGTPTLTASATGLSSGTQVETVAGPPTHFAVTTSTATPTAGTAFSVTVTAQNASNNTVTSYTGTVHFSLTNTDSGATLPTNYTFVGGDNGTHTFTNGVTLTKVGAQTINVNDTVSTSITGSANVTVSAGTATKLFFTTSTFTDVVGQCSSQITVQTQDGSGNPSNPATDTTVNLSSDSGGTFYSASNCTGLETTVTVLSTGNTASFYYKDSHAGTPTITASATGFSSATQKETIEPKLGFTSNAFKILQGQCSSAITVQAQNGDGSAFTVTSDTVVALSTSSAGAFYSGSDCTGVETSVTIANGTSTSSNFYYKDTTVGGPTLTASAFSNATQTTQIETIAQLAFSTTAFTSVAGGCSPQITIQAQDSSNVSVTLTVNATVALSTTSGGGSFYSDSGCATPATNPITNFTSSTSFYYKDTTVGSPTLKGTAYTYFASQIETIDPKLVFTSTAFTALQGQCSTAMTVQTQDGLGNAYNVGSNTVVSLSSSSGGTYAFYSDSGCATPEVSVTIATGSSTSPGFYYKDTALGGPTVTASAFSGVSQATQAETIAKLVFSSTAFTVLEGQCSPAAAIQAQNSSNVAVNLSSSASVGLSSNSAGTKAFYSDSGCNTTETTVTIASGSSTSSSFYYKDTALGGPTLTGSAYSASTTQVETIAKLAYSSTPVSVIVGQCSTAITIQSQNSSSAAVNLSSSATVSLSSSSAGGAFYSNSGCTSSVSSVTISSGSSSASFYYEDSNLGSPVITASAYSASAMQTETVTPIPTTTTVTSNLTTIQFSDAGLNLGSTVTTEFLLAGQTPSGSVDFKLVGGDGLACSGSAPVPRSIDLGSASLSFTGNTGTASLNGVQIKDPCAWSIMTSGDAYTVHAVFVSTNAYYAGGRSASNPTLTVNPETALTTTYTGATFVSTSGTSAATLLTASVAQDTGDGYIASFNDLNAVPPSGSTTACTDANPTACRIYVAFQVIGGSGCSSGTSYARVIGSGAVGTASVSPTLNVCGYLVTATVVQQPVAGNVSYLYWTPGPDGTGGVVVANGSGPNTSGGGWVPDNSSYNGKDNFGFTVKFNKQGTSLQGNSMFMYRTTADVVCDGGSHGELVNTQVKTNSLQALGLIGSNEVVFSAKANVNVTDAITGALVCSYGAGNSANFTQTVVDGGTTGPDKYELIVSFGTRSITISLQPIGNGQIVVHTQ